MINKFSVPDPCHEKWDRMNPQENGRYCGACQKVVIDFTKMSDQEIIDHISANSGKKMCGTFKNSQIQSANQYLQLQRNDSMLKFLAALLLVFGMTLFSCSTPETKEPEKCPEPLTGIIISAPASDTLRDSTIMEPPLRTTEIIPECTTTGDMIVDGEIETDPPSVISDSIPFIEQEAPYVIMDVMPEFEGGTQALYRYITGELKYPSDQEVQGTVYISFVILKDGTVDQVKVLKGLTKAYDDEAIRVVRSMPKWKPGIKNGKVVNGLFNLPIKFRL